MRSASTNIEFELLDRGYIAGKRADVASPLMRQLLRRPMVSLNGNIGFQLLPGDL
jgi:hypothetical protein